MDSNLSSEGTAAGGDLDSAMLVVMCVFGALAVIGNIFNVVVIARCKTSSLVLLYMSSTSTADCLLGLAAILSTSKDHNTCVVSGYLLSVCTAQTSIMLGTFAVDRYMAVVVSRFYKEAGTALHQVTVWVVSSWLWALLVYCPTLHLTDRHYRGYCVRELRLAWDQLPTFAVLQLFTCYVIEFGAIVCCLLAAIYSWWMDKDEENVIISYVDILVHRMTLRAKKHVTSLVLQTPAFYGVWSFYSVAQFSGEDSGLTRMAATILTLVYHSVLKTLIYLATEAEFRTEFVRYSRNFWPLSVAMWRNSVKKWRYWWYENFHFVEIWSAEQVALIGIEVKPKKTFPGSAPIRTKKTDIKTHLGGAIKAQHKWKNLMYARRPKSAQGPKKLFAPNNKQAPFILTPENNDAPQKNSVWSTQTSQIVEQKTASDASLKSVSDTGTDLIISRQPVENTKMDDNFEMTRDNTNLNSSL